MFVLLQSPFSHIMGIFLYRRSRTFINKIISSLHTNIFNDIFFCDLHKSFELNRNEAARKINNASLLWALKQ